MAFPTRRTIVSMLLGMVALLSACGSTTATSAAPKLAANQTLTLPNVGVSEISTFDPALPSDLNSAEAIQLTFSGLVTLDPKTLNVVADMAQDVPSVANGEITNNGSTYTFKLKPGLKFSDGNPVTASDFAFSIDRSLDPRLKSNVATVYLGAIKGAMDRYAGTNGVTTIIGTGVVVVDPSTLQINLAQPVAYFLEAMTYSTSFAVEQSNASFTNAKWTDTAVGTGPFMLKEWVHSDHMTFVPNPNWYGAKSKITQITMPFIKDTEVAYKSYKAKELDMDGLGATITSADYADAKALPSHQLQEGPYLETNYISPNWNVAPFNNQAVRQAFAYATDRDTIAKTVLKDSVYSSDHIVPNGMPGYFAGLQGLAFNPTKAKQLLTSVYPDPTKVPAITLTYPDVGDNKAIALELQSEYTQYLGVTIQLNGEDFNKLVNDVYGNNLQFYMLAWIADYPDPQDWLSLQFTKGAPNNTMNFNDPNFDALTNKADVEQNQATRFTEYNQAEELAVDEVAWIPFSQSKNTYVVQPWVSGFTVDAGGLIPDSVWANVYVTQH